MKTTTATVIDQQSMKATTATPIDLDRQFLNPDYCSLIKNSLDILNNMEIDLESIMVREFARGLPSDIEGGDL